MGVTSFGPGGDARGPTVARSAHSGVIPQVKRAPGSEMDSPHIKYRGSCLILAASRYRDDDGVHDLVGEGLALGAVPDREQPAEVAGRAVEQVREQPEERSSRPEGPARPLVDQPGPGDLFAPALPGGTLPEGAAPEPGGRERIALQLRVLDNGGNPRRTNEVVMSCGRGRRHLTTHLRRRATARRFCDVLWTRLGR